MSPGPAVSWVEGLRRLLVAWFMCFPFAYSLSKLDILCSWFSASDYDHFGWQTDWHNCRQSRVIFPVLVWTGNTKITHLVANGKRFSLPDTRPAAFLEMIKSGFVEISSLLSAEKWTICWVTNWQAENIDTIKWDYLRSRISGGFGCATPVDQPSVRLISGEPFKAANGRT